jgi:hypothetical protein
VSQERVWAVFDGISLGCCIRPLSDNDRAVLAPATHRATVVYSEREWEDAVFSINDVDYRVISAVDPSIYEEAMRRKFLDILCEEVGL